MESNTSSASNQQSLSFSAIFANVIAAPDIASASFPPLTEFIEGWLVPGLTLLVGKPKKGKSWLALDWVLSAGAGLPAMGTVPTVQTESLFIALEDSRRRIQKRMLGLGVGPPAACKFVTEWPRGKKGVSAIAKWLKHHPDCRIVVIDVLGKFKGATVGTASAYDADYSALEGLHSLAKRCDVAIVVVHHMRKADSVDMIDLASGTLGLTGVADHIIALRPAERLSEDLEFVGDLEIQGRDLQSQHVDLTFEDGQWRVHGPCTAKGDKATEAKKRAARDDLIRKLKAEGLSNREIATKVGCDEKTVRHVLKG